MPSPIVIHVLRPYASEEEYLANERASISPKTMLLLDQPPLPVDTAIVFDVSLDNGDKPIRAEGIVLGYAEPTREQPGGIRVRFKRYGAATKAFIERANATAAAALPAQPSSPGSDELPVPPAALHAIEAQQVSRIAPIDAQDDHREPAESSGVHRKVALPVEPPINREALLDRLRARRVS